ncbi:MAG: hypothetical protein JKY65_32135 [Planctomycetes bacterium]|nr:hypothetical protein [Planctomycetota bacterium]
MTQRSLSLILTAALLLGAAGPARGDEIDPTALEASIERGLKWLSGLQQPDGSFKLPPNRESLETGFPMGFSALATLTLLKCGTPPNDPRIVKAFQHLYTLPLRKTYSVSVLVLAIEARYVPPAKAQKKRAKKSYSSVARRFFRGKARKVDLQKLQECVAWLVGHRSKTMAGWRYPEGIDQDNSCTQYAMLALKGARRLGAEVKPEVFAQVADFFVAQQDATGPEVPFFPVPAADGPIYDMLGPEQRKKAELKWKKREEKAKRRSGTRVRQPKETREREVFNARGWSYLHREPQDAPSSRTGPVPTYPKSEQTTTGSMTSSGIAALCIAKSELETHKRYWRPRRDAVETAIRDGCAWLATHWKPESNPGSAGWKYYYLYSVERAGVLAGTYRFGEHDWWEEGAVHLLATQEQAGTWPDAKGLSRLSRTCFALLFLKRATIPLVPLPPKRVMTGGKR